MKVCCGGACDSVAERLGEVFMPKDDGYRWLELDVHLLTRN
ncbi:hypothetical protein [Virgibacillus ainsalahensis]